uniref:Uncharacterized protein n=1 Tax=Salmo trutta TaxID=8032 RepID=A0A673X1G5_SALTR
STQHIMHWLTIKLSDHFCIDLSLLLACYREIGHHRPQMEALEAAVSEKIRAHVPITIQVFCLDDPSLFSRPPGF